MQLGAIDQATNDPVQAVKDAELVVLCTPVGEFRQVLEKIAAALPCGVLLTDVGSTKRSICLLAEKILPDGVRFVGSHPMVGSEKRGIEAAFAELYRGGLCITTPTNRTDPGALAQIESFWKSLGMNTLRLAPDEHDRLLSDASHLPHALAAALVMAQSDQSMQVVGKGFADLTRIAAGDAGLWRDILLDNADNLKQSLKRLRSQLDRLESLLTVEQADQLYGYLHTAAEKRRSLNDRNQA